MIVMNVEIDNFFSFKNFCMNMSYPKKILNSTIADEHLDGFPNFRYKKVNIIMGANATGKTTFGRFLMTVFNFMDKKQFEKLTSYISDKTQSAHFSMDFITSGTILYRITTEIAPRNGEEYKVADIDVCVQQVEIRPRDSYESCSDRFEKTCVDKKRNYIEELEKVQGLSWLFEYPSDSKDRYNVHISRDRDQYLYILEKVLKALDPAIIKVDEIPNVENTYVIRMREQEVIIQNGKIIDTDVLSSGTKAGIELAGVLASIINKQNRFYYCDEKFSYVHSDIEKAFLSVMIESLKSNDQLFFTTHNTDILDMDLPKHSFIFMKKNNVGENSVITCISASEYLKRNTDSVRNAVDNDLFSSAPSVDLIYAILEERF